MVQVVTNENVIDLIQGNPIAEFKAPEAAKAPEAKAEPPKEEKPRDTETGQFKTAEPKVDDKPGDPVKASQEAESDDLSEASEKLKKKIDRLIGKEHRLRKEAEEFGRDEARRAMAAEARADALHREIQALKGAKSDGPKSDDGDKEPDQADFKTVGEYGRAVVKWELAQARKAENAERAEQSTRQTQAEAERKLIAKVAEARKEFPDYADVMKSAPTDIPGHIGNYIVESDNGAAMAYHLLKSRENYDRIASLSPIRAIAELGKMEDKLFGKPPSKAEEKQPAASLSKAPPPIQPLEAKTVPVETDPSKMDFKQLRALREQEKRTGKWRA